MNPFVRASAVLTMFAATILFAERPASSQTVTPLATDKPENVGMSSTRLGRIHEAVQGYLDRHELAGAVSLVARKGKVVHFETHGYADIEAKKSMTKETVFRMASCSKPVTAVAVLILMEEGKLRLSDPVEKFLPEFKDLKVAVPKSDPKQLDLLIADRPISLRDLLTHTSGLGSYGPGSREQMPKLIESRMIDDRLELFVPKFAQLHLDFQPGTKWEYSGLPAFDILGRVVEVVSGKSFGDFLKERLFAPLGMSETTFGVPQSRLDRAASIYRVTDKGLERQDPPMFALSETYHSGAGGLSSTTEDIARFTMMLTQGGALNDVRILSPKSVELMGSNHVGTLFGGQLGRPAKGLGFGLGVEVVLDPIQADWRRSVGSFGWDGAFGTIFWADPKEQISAVLMIQRHIRDLHRDFENAIRQAIVE